MVIVPSAMNIFKDSPANNTANIAANIGLEETIIADLEGPIELIDMLFINLPPG